MPSLKSGLRNSYRLDRSSSRDGEHFDDQESRMTDYKKRGSSLPATCSSISVKLLPTIRHCLTDPNIWTSKTIPKNVIETDYLFQPNSSEDEKTADKNNKRQKESNYSSQSAITEPNSSVHPDVCRDLQKAFLDGLSHRMITRRGRNNFQESSYNVLLKADLLDRVSLDIVRMSEREPAGLNGCRLRTRVERQHSADMELGCVRVDQDTEETFEIVLSLKEECQKTSEKRHPGLIGNVSSLLTNLLRHSLHRGRIQPVEVHVSDAYQLEKIKLQKCSDSNNIAKAHSVCLCSA